MEAERFDGLITTLGASRTRRRLMGLAGSGLLAAAIFGRTPASEARHKKRCRNGFKRCHSTCIDPLTDNTNCGTCDSTCSGDTSCQNGQCRCSGSAFLCGIDQCCVRGAENCNGTTCVACGTLGTTCTVAAECCLSGPGGIRDCQDPPGGASQKICCIVSGHSCTQGQDAVCCSGHCVANGSIFACQ